MNSVRLATVKNRSASGTVRGTQLLVEHMGEILHRPTLTLLEVLWRWAVGVPFLWLCWIEWGKIIAAYPLQSSGIYAVDTENPWVATVQLAGVWSYYQPHVDAVLRWLVPAVAAAWIVASGLGRAAVLRRMEPGTRMRPLSMMALQCAWVFLFALTILGWFRSMQWVSVQHIATTGEPDLVGYSIWAIFLTLGLFTVFALISWVFSIAPILMVMEGRSALSALGQGFKLKLKFASKLTEINLVMGVVKLTLMVVAMVLSAAPLPFSDELGAQTLHKVVMGAMVFYLIANDYFQVVRLKAFVEFWKVFRGPTSI